jgi:hypothetical protein
LEQCANPARFLCVHPPTSLRSSCWYPVVVIASTGIVSWITASAAARKDDCQASLVGTEIVLHKLRLRLKEKDVGLVAGWVCAAQRFALLALGRAWILFGSRKNSKPEKCSKMPQNPQRPVHALLGALFERQRTCSIMNYKPLLIRFYPQLLFTCATYDLRLFSYQSPAYSRL